MLNRRHHLLLYRSIVVGVLSLMRSALRLLLVAIGSCAYAGLAVLGWGGFRSFFSHPAFVALVVVLLALSVVASFAGGNLSVGVRETRGNRWVIPVFVLIGFLNAYLPAYTDRRDLWTIDGDTIRWVGVALFAAGGALRIWPVFVLGERFSGLVAIQPGHTLVTGGIYGVIRHPSYLGLLINSLGWSPGFSFGSRCASHTVAYSAAASAHRCRRKLAVFAVW
jgi:hypothetical protein